MPEAALSVKIGRFLEHVLIPLHKSVTATAVQPAVEQVVQLDIGAAKTSLPTTVRRHLHPLSFISRVSICVYPSFACLAEHTLCAK